MVHLMIQLYLIYLFMVRKNNKIYTLFNIHVVLTFPLSPCCCIITQKNTMHWEHLGYVSPPGCKLVKIINIETKDSTLCAEEQALNLTHCELADNITDPCIRWTILEWFFTAKPRMFGLVGGYANVTGFVLLAILTLMCICSMPFVRKSGHFQVYTTFVYTTHIAIVISEIYWTAFI